MTFSSSSCPQGDRIGWVDGEGLYLDQYASYLVVQKMLATGDEAISLSCQTLAKRLSEAGHLVSTEQEARGTLTIRKTLEGSRRAVLHLRATCLAETSDSHEGQTAA